MNVVIGCADVVKLIYTTFIICLMTSEFR